MVSGGRSAIVLDTEQSYPSYLLPYRRAGMDKRFGKEISTAELRLETAAKRRRLPEPDSLSNLLESFAASRGEPIGERLGALEDGDPDVTVQALSGDKVPDIEASTEGSGDDLSLTALGASHP